MSASAPRPRCCRMSPCCSARVLSPRGYLTRLKRMMPLRLYVWAIREQTTTYCPLSLNQDYRVSIVHLVIVRTRCRFIKAWVGLSRLSEVFRRGEHFRRASRPAQSFGRRRREKHVRWNWRILKAPAASTPLCRRVPVTGPREDGECYAILLYPILRSCSASSSSARSPLRSSGIVTIASSPSSVRGHSSRGLSQ